MFPVIPGHSSLYVHYYTTVFDVCDRMVCINITFSDDDILENFDRIYVLLNTVHSLISCNVSWLSIEVQDDDDGE